MDEIVEKKKVALEQKDTAKSALLDLVFRAYELSQVLESPGCEETRKAHSDAQKMVELIVAEVKRREAEIVALDEEEKTIHNAVNNLWTIF